MSEMIMDELASLWRLVSSVMWGLAEIVVGLGVLALVIIAMAPAAIAFTLGVLHLLAGV